MGTDKPLSNQPSISTQPAYQRLALELTQKIERGELSAGSKLPSIRRLAADKQVSINTVRSAVELLQQLDLVKGIPRQGLIVQAKAVTTEIPYEDFTPDTRLPKQSRQWLSRLVQSEHGKSPFVQMVLPDHCPLFLSFQRQYRKAVTQLPRRSADDSSGNLALRQVLREQYQRRHLNVNSADIQMTNGCQNALEHALRAICKPGDVVALPVPAYPGYLALLAMLRLGVIEIPTSPAGPDSGILQQLMVDQKIQLLLLNPNCHNPTGTTYTDDLKRAIAGWASRYEIPVIEDDICAEISFSHPGRPIASYDNQGWCVVISSISKLVGDSERIGWCLPGRFRDTYKTQFAISQINTSYYGQAALQRYLAGSRYPRQLQQWRQHTKAALQQTQQYLQQRLGARISITQPGGGYALWVRLPNGMDATVLSKALTMPRVDIMPGELFSLSGRFKQYFRLVMMPPFSPWHQEALEHICDTIEALNEE